MKHCRGCDRWLANDNFGVHKSNPDGRQYRCRECRRAYGRNWYAGASEVQKARVRAASLRNRQEARQFVLAYLHSHPCVDCGEGDPIVLEFDHRDPATKKFSISNLFNHSWVALDELAAEINQCDVRCSNCHKRRTAQQFGWWKANAA